MIRAVSVAECSTHHLTYKAIATALYDAIRLAIISFCHPSGPTNQLSHFRPSRYSQRQRSRQSEVLLILCRASNQDHAGIAKRGMRSSVESRRYLAECPSPRPARFLQTVPPSCTLALKTKKLTATKFATDIASILPATGTSTNSVSSPFWRCISFRSFSDVIFDENSFL